MRGAAVSSAKPRRDSGCCTRAMRVRSPSARRRNETGYRAGGAGLGRPVPDFQARQVRSAVVGRKPQTKTQPKAPIEQSCRGSLGAMTSRRRRGVESGRALAVLETMAVVSLTVPARGEWWCCPCPSAGAVLLADVGHRLVLPNHRRTLALGTRPLRNRGFRRPGAAPGVVDAAVRDLAHLCQRTLWWGWLGQWGIREPTNPSPTVVRRQCAAPEPGRTVDIRRWTVGGGC